VTNKFTAEMFTPTEWSTAADKAKFANHFVRFVQSGFKETMFPKWFYKQLSMTFGHIAHYNKNGFYSTWFATPDARVDFIKNCIAWGAYGDPEYTYCDVENALKAWLVKSGTLGVVTSVRNMVAEIRERGMLAQLQAKYGSR
jgi:hypothetical protein